MILYRIVSAEEKQDILNTGSFRLISGEKFFSTDIAYIDYIRDGKRRGKRTYRNGTRQHVLSVNVPDERLVGKLAVKRSPKMAASWRRLKTWNNHDQIQVKEERDSITLGFFSQTVIDLVFGDLPIIDQDRVDLWSMMGT